SNTGGDQFFPAIAPDNAGGVYVTYSQVTDAGAGTYDQWLADANSGGVGSSIKVSTASSYPNTDFAFGGKFIGDYSGRTAPGGSPHPMWPDLRTDLAFFGNERDT